MAADYVSMSRLYRSPFQLGNVGFLWMVPATKCCQLSKQTELATSNVELLPRVSRLVANLHARVNLESKAIVTVTIPLLLQSKC